MLFVEAELIDQDVENTAADQDAGRHEHRKLEHVGKRPAEAPAAERKPAEHRKEADRVDGAVPKDRQAKDMADLRSEIVDDAGCHSCTSRMQSGPVRSPEP